MFTALDFLYICLGVGFLALIVFMCFALFSVIKFFGELKILIREIKLMKDGMKLGALTFVKNILSGRR